MVHSSRPASQPFSRLLVATDFTAGAALAVSRVSRLPLARRPQVTLLHVVPRGVGARWRGQERSEAAGRLEAEAGRLKRALRARGLESSRVRQAIAMGEPFEEIIT